MKNFTVCIDSKETGHIGSFLVFLAFNTKSFTSLFQPKLSFVTKCLSTVFQEKKVYHKMLNPST